jgi:CCR4-NOT transcription complex subunit 1
LLACTEVSIDTYIKAKAQGGNMQTGIYQPVDALGTLIAFMLKYHGDGSTHKGAADAKAFYLTKGACLASTL